MSADISAILDLDDDQFVQTWFDMPEAEKAKLPATVRAQAPERYRKLHPYIGNSIKSCEQALAKLGADISEIQARSSTTAFPIPAPITLDEWSRARPTPDCIVQDYLFADVACVIAPGSMGKTTLKLYEAIRIVLGLPLYGLKVLKPGPVVFITAEDSRELLVARLRLIAQAMMLTEEQMAIVRESVLIDDVSGNGFRLTKVVSEVVMPSGSVDWIVAACRTIQPVLIVIDPAVSFGVGESRVNDAEQGLVEAARKLRAALNCCVQYIHHTGKQNARDKAVDQYAGRGGSAFADGSRMVHVLQNLTPKEWRDETGTDLLTGETGLRLARPKMSYCPPQADILIRRIGYRFTHAERVATSKQARVETAANQVWQFLNFEWGKGLFHTKHTLESQDIGLSRREIRAAVNLLTASLRIEPRPIPILGKGGRYEYLHPIASPNPNGEPTEKSSKTDECLANEKGAIASPPPIDGTPAANQPPPDEPSLFYGSPDSNGEPMATPANQYRPRVEGEL